MSLRDFFLRGLHSTDPVLWIDKHIKVSEIGEPFRLEPYQREILRAAFRFDRQGYLRYRTILLSMPKKSGKTTLNAVLTLWWGMMIEAPNELYILANDEEQAKGRVYSAVVQLLQRNAIDPTTKVQTDNITLSNGTTIQVLSSDYTSSAGSNMGLSSWDELWGYTSEKSQRLYEEMVPVLTRKNSVRLITSYAGVEGESRKLHDLYIRGVDKSEHHDGQGVRIHPTLPIYENAAAELFCYWDHEARAPWQQGPKAEQYLATQKQDLRLSTFLRYYFNRWSSSESAFLTAIQYDACVDHTLRPHSLPQGRLFLGVDAATKRDCASVVGVAWSGKDLVLQCHEV